MWEDCKTSVPTLVRPGKTEPEGPFTLLNSLAYNTQVVSSGLMLLEAVSKIPPSGGPRDLFQNLESKKGRSQSQREHYAWLIP
jgi:hypothetical protein